MVPGSFLLMAVFTVQTSAGVTLQGQITTEIKDPSIRLVLEDSKARNAEVARTEADSEGHYEFRGISGRNYRLVATIDGKKQERREVEIVCRPGAVVSKDFH